VPSVTLLVVIERLPEASKKAALLEGCVQNTDLMPAEKFTFDPELDDVSTVSLAN